MSAARYTGETLRAIFDNVRSGSQSIEELRLQIVHDISNSLIPKFLEKNESSDQEFKAEIIGQIYTYITIEYFNSINGMLIDYIVRQDNDTETIDKLLNWLIQYTAKNLEEDFVKEILNIESFMNSTSQEVPKDALSRVLEIHGKYLSSLQSLPVSPQYIINDAISNSVSRLRTAIEPYQLDVNHMNELIELYQRALNPSENPTIVMDELGYKFTDTQ